MLTLSAQIESVGSIQDLIASTMANIRKEPTRADLRVSLFQLFCITGNWQRALGQLVSAATLDPNTEEMARAYREVIRCEVYRGKVFSGTKVPLFIGEPDVWLVQLVESLRLNAVGSAHDAAILRNEAFSAAQASVGAIDGESFEWIADMDMRLGPVLEAIIDGKYYWIPFYQLKHLEIEAPVDMRDLVWIPSKLTFSTGGEQVAFIPVRYSGTETSEDEGFILARKTDWRTIDDEAFAGTGQRMFSTNAGEYSLLDIRNVELNT